MDLCWHANPENDVVWVALGCFWPEIFPRLFDSWPELSAQVWCLRVTCASTSPPYPLTQLTTMFEPRATEVRFLSSTAPNILMSLRTATATCARWMCEYYFKTSNQTLVSSHRNWRIQKQEQRSSVYACFSVNGGNPEVGGNPTVPARTWTRCHLKQLLLSAASWTIKSCDWCLTRILLFLHLAPHQACECSGRSENWFLF